LFEPEDPLKPRDAVFDEPWHAQVLAIADTMVQAGTFSASDWAGALGAALKAAEARGDDDTAETYYLCATEALEGLVARNTQISGEALAERKAAWARAYLATPHGKPVDLEAGKQ